MLIWLIVGAMMKKLRNSDSPSSTWFGGVCCSPSAWRRIARTMMIRVKLVIINRMPGRTVSSPMMMRTCRLSDSEPLCPVLPAA